MDSAGMLQLSSSVTGSLFPMLLFYYNRQTGPYLVFDRFEEETMNAHRVHISRPLKTKEARAIDWNRIAHKKIL